MYTIDGRSCGGKYVGETKRLHKARWKEHRDEVEKIGDAMPFTRGNRKTSERERHKSAIMEEQCGGLGKHYDSGERK